jgi:predicted ester cyclase
LWLTPQKVPSVQSMLDCMRASWDSDPYSCMAIDLADNFAHHVSGAPEEPGNRDATKQAWLSIAAAFRACPFVVDGVLSMENRVFVRWHLAGTCHGLLCGVEAAGRQLRLEGVTFAHSREDRIVEAWSLVDRFTLMRQLCGVGETH